MKSHFFDELKMPRIKIYTRQNICILGVYIYFTLLKVILSYEPTIFKKYNMNIMATYGENNTELTAFKLLHY